MYPVIYKYLLQHKKVSIPGIGSFVMKHKPANVNTNENLLNAPETAIVYQAETALADKSFYNFVSNELHIEEIEAIKNFHEYTYQLKQDATKAEAIVLPGIGKLTKQADGSYDFLQETVLQEYYAAVPFTEISKEKLTGEASLNTLTLKNENFDDIDLSQTEEETEKEDYWWIYAAILGLIGVAAIVYKFI